MARSALPLLAGALFGLLVGGVSRAQPADDAPHDWGFEPIAAVLDAGTASRPDGVWLTRTLDAPLDACVAHYQRLADRSAEVGDGLQVAGVGMEVASGGWTVTLVRPPNELYRLALIDDGGRCREELRASTHVVRDADWRVAMPPLPTVGGPTYDPDEPAR